MYSKEIWDEIIRLHIEEGRTYQSLHEEFGPAPGVIGAHIRQYRIEARENEAQAEILGNMEEIRRLREELAETKKENDFLKKLAAFYAKESK